jgi:hypothetical protein
MTTTEAIVNGTGKTFADYEDKTSSSTYKQLVPLVTNPTGHAAKHAPFNKLYPETQLKQTSLSKHLLQKVSEQSVQTPLMMTACVSGHVAMQKLLNRTKSEVQLVQFIELTHEEQAVGQSVHTLVLLNILAGHSLEQLLLNKIPVRQLKQVFVVFVHVAQGEVQAIHVLFKG